MSINTVAFKKTMLAWDAIAKKAPIDIVQEVKKIAGEHPEAEKLGTAWVSQITTINHTLHDALDKVVNAKDDKSRADAAKNASGIVKKYQAFVTGTHLPPDVQTHLKNGLAELAKGLGT